jgi:hypothetical protein
MVNVAASVAVIVRIEVVSAATVAGFAVIVTVGTFSVPLPVNRAHPDRSARDPIEVQPKRMRNVLRSKGAVDKVLSLIHFNMDSQASVSGIEYPAISKGAF